MMKKLSSTFRRNKSSSISPVNSDGTPRVSHPIPVQSVSSAAVDEDNLGLSALTNAYQRVLVEQNRQQVELQRLRSMNEGVPSTPLAPYSKGRAKTFSSGESGPSPGLEAGSENTIPFFQEKGPNDTAAVLPVRGTPAWHKKKFNDLSATRVKPPRPAPRRHVTAPSYEGAFEINAKPYDKPRQSSFSGLLRGDSRSTSTSSVPPALGRLTRLAAGKRWKAPRSADGSLARFGQLPGNAKNTIVQRRDRVEALPLASACAHLEAEIFRIRRTADELRCCCARDNAPICECAHRMATLESVDRLVDILGILEDRFDAIEEYYVKGKEYAQAMGKFYNVSPNEYTRWVGERQGKGKRAAR